MLQPAFYLLDRGKTPCALVEDASVGDLARAVATRYMHKITRPRSQFNENNTIPGEPGQVIRRKCCRCMILVSQVHSI